jgi:hypothetical protein
MILFFRRRRKQLADENQFLKYSRYALGEILLVVLGILIALYINNWNEQRMERERLDAALIDVESELIANINRCRDALRYFFYCDSVASKVLYDGLSTEDYMNEERISRLSNIAVWYDSPVIQDESFKNLKQTTGNRSKVQDSIILELSKLYIEKKNGVDMFALEAHSTVMENRKMYSEFDWYKDWWLTGAKNNEMIHFLVNDQRHESAVINFSSVVLENFRRLIEDFEITALRSYRGIHQYLDQNMIQHKHSLLFEYDIEEFQHYVGSYVPYENSTVFDNVTDSVVISVEDEKIVYRVIYKNGRSFKSDVIPVDRYRFRTSFGSGFYRLDFKGQEQVSELVFSNGKYRTKAKKVR